MRIGIDCHNLEGQRTGVGRYVWNLLRQFSIFNFQTSFFLYFKNDTPKDIHELLHNFRGRENYVQIHVLDTKSNALFKHFYLPRAARQDKVDVLFCPDYVLPLRLDRRIKAAVTIHDIIYEARPEDYSWPSWKDKVLLKWASKQSAKKADIIFVPSGFTKSEVLKYYKVNPQKIIVTPLATDRVFKEAPSLAKGEVEGVGKFILFVGSIFNRRFLPQKIQGFTEFAKTRKDFKFLIIGNNHTKPYQDIGNYIAQANNKLGREAIVWRKYVESDGELAKIYNASFATIWLSSYEGFGLPILESMACGTPVITSPHGSLPEIAGDAAMYVAHPQNSQEIASALTRLVSDDFYRNELISKGLARAAQFSWQKCARETIDKLLAL